MSGLMGWNVCFRLQNNELRETVQSLKEVVLRLEKGKETAEPASEQGLTVLDLREELHALALTLSRCAASSSRPPLLLLTGCLQGFHRLLRGGFRAVCKMFYRLSARYFTCCLQRPYATSLNQNQLRSSCQCCSLTPVRGALRIDWLA